jgi:hypothetical protein
MSEEQPYKHRPRYLVPLFVLLLLMTPCAAGWVIFITCFTNFSLH